MKSRIILNLAILSLVIGGILYAEEIGVVIGGACSYERIPGTGKIISIAKTGESTRQVTVTGGPGYEGYVIRFTFSPLQEKQENIKMSPDYMAGIIEKEHTLQLTNSWYPGDKFLEKYKIEVGKIFNCVMSLITRGSCSPVIFGFPDINTSDYFETKR
ncbi:MAG: hypothetical protein NTW64_02360 [Candidatus Omnitrophica bacterium]|nr:hypothetical protein [Candidatus Omnitrophota bacterium]